jgi:Holliday junction DNA helicase RuvA
LIEKDPSEIVVDAGGVGYRVAVSLTTFGRLPAAGETVTLSIHTHVREDALALYGFDSRRERDLFEDLIGVPGIGPRLGLALLSHLDPRDLAAAVESKDIDRLTGVPGIGRKTAERLLVELAGRMKRFHALPGAVAEPAPAESRKDDLVSALVNLGYRQAQAVPAVEAVLAAASPGDLLPALLRESLRRLSAGRVAS